MKQGHPNTRQSVCIVGHGPSLQGRSLGVEIDKYDIVIRMINCAWQDKVDYGTKHDISIHCPTQPQFKDDPQMPDFGYFIYYPTGWDKHLLVPNVTFRRKPSFGDDAWLAELHGEEKPFSRGAAAALLATRFFYVGTLCFAGTVKLCSDLNEKYPDHHPSLLELSHPYKGRTDTHNWENEARTLQDTTDRQNIKLEFLECS